VKVQTIHDIQPVLHEYAQPRTAVWDALWLHRAPNRIALAIMPNDTALDAVRQDCAALRLDYPAQKPPGWTEAWDKHLMTDVIDVYARMRLPGDAFLSLSVPSFAHGQSQGICDLFGARVETLPSGHEHVHPFPADPGAIHALAVRPIQASRYWNAVAYIVYARAATQGVFEFRNPVMTGPLDTANYLLGTTTLMEWVYTEPETLHVLLGKITDVLIAMITALRKAAGGVLHARHFACMCGGFDVCSECRSLVSRETYEAFEAPYLRRLGETLGPYGIHSCGSWERTVPSALQDPNLHAMNGQIRENDWQELCRLSQGRMTYSIAPSTTVAEKYTWRTMAEFYEFIIETTPDSQPLELSLSEDDLPVWNQLCHTHRRAGCILQDTRPSSSRFSPWITQGWRVSKLLPKAPDLASAAGVTLLDALDWRSLTPPDSPNNRMSLHYLYNDQDGLVYFGLRFRVVTAGLWGLYLGHDGGIKLFLNGRQLAYQPEQVNPVKTDRTKVTTDLSVGSHELIVAIDTNKGKGSAITFRFQTPADSNYNMEDFPVHEI